MTNTYPEDYTNCDIFNEAQKRMAAIDALINYTRGKYLREMDELTRRYADFKADAEEAYSKLTEEQR